MFALVVVSLSSIDVATHGWTDVGPSAILPVDDGLRGFGGGKNLLT